MSGQYTIRILDGGEQTDLVTSKSSCLIGRSLISDIRIHLPSIKEMHLEINMKEKFLTAYGGDVKINDSEVAVNKTVSYQYGDKISLRNKNFIVLENEEYKEEVEFPLIVVEEEEAAEKDRLQVSEDFVVDKFKASNGDENAEPRELEKESFPSEKEAEVCGDEAVKNKETPTFFNESTSSAEFIVKEKNLIDEEIRKNIEIGKENANVSIKCNKEKPMDLKEAVIEKAILEEASNDSNKPAIATEDKNKLPEDARNASDAEIRQESVKDELKGELKEELRSIVKEEILKEKEVLKEVVKKEEEKEIEAKKKEETVVENNGAEIAKTPLKGEKESLIDPVKKRVRLASAASPSRSVYDVENEETSSKRTRKVAVKGKSNNNSSAKKRGARNKGRRRN